MASLTYKWRIWVQGRRSTLDEMMGNKDEIEDEPAFHPLLFPTGVNCWQQLPSLLLSLVFIYPNTQMDRPDVILFQWDNLE